MGALFAELDEVQARLAEVQARQHPRDAKLRQGARRAEKPERESDIVAETVGSLDQRNRAGRFPLHRRSKKLYREIAKLIHPDLTTDERERTRRTRLMAEANRAYEDGDEAKLRAILDGWVASPESVQGEGVAAELVRTIRKIHQVGRRLVDIETETLELKGSELYSSLRSASKWRKHEAAICSRRWLSN